MPDVGAADADCVVAGAAALGAAACGAGAASAFAAGAAAGAWPSASIVASNIPCETCWPACK